MNNENLKNLFANDPEVLRILEAREQKKLLKEMSAVKPSAEGVFVQMIDLLKGKDGQDGKTPTEEELVALVEPLIPEPVPGENGIDGTPGADGRDGKDGKDGKDGTDGRDGKDGKDGVDGKDATPQDVIEEIKNLKGKEEEDFSKKVGAKIDISHIRNANSFIFNGKRIKFGELLHGGGSSGGAGNPAGNNTEIQYNDNGVFGASSLFTWDNSQTTLTLADENGTGIIKGGDAVTQDVDGTPFNFSTGAATATGTGKGGTLVINTGQSGNNAEGADITIEAGGSGGGDNNGGDLNLTAGVGTGAGVDGNIIFNSPTRYIGATSGYVQVQASSVAGDWVMTLPVDDGLPNQFLQTDGNGVLDWATPSGSVTFIDNEIVAGSNQTFTLANVPVLGTEHIYAAGQRLYPGVGYTIASDVVTTTFSWSAGDLLADYQTP